MTPRTPEQSSPAARSPRSRTPTRSGDQRPARGQMVDLLEPDCPDWPEALARDVPQGDVATDGTGHRVSRAFDADLVGQAETVDVPAARASTSADWPG